MEEPEWCRNSKLVQDALQLSSTTSFDALGNYKLKFTDDATKEKRILVKMIKSNCIKKLEHASMFHSTLWNNGSIFSKKVVLSCIFHLNFPLIFCTTSFNEKGGTFVEHCN